MAPSKAALAHAERARRQSSRVSEENTVKISDPSVESQIKKGTEFARKKVGEMLSSYKIIDPSNLDEVPLFGRDELQYGKVLGRGGFGVVNEITGITIKTGPCDGDESSPQEADDFESKAFIAKHCIRFGDGGGKGDARYAVKYLSAEVKADPNRFVQGIMDMNVETHFLAAIEHPNIIKMRAIASCDPFDARYFIVMDRLYDTLEARLRKWDSKNRKSSTFIGKAMDKKGKKKEKLLEERLVVAFDLSAALEYLHGLNIIYRDLKPENIGFDIRGDVKLFDFGLAKEVDPAKKAEDDCYSMTGDTGSLRYMAPEIAQHKNYNFSVDTYSFAILLWEVMALSKPFSGYNVNMHREKVVLGGHRPKVDDSWSISLKTLMKRGWSEDITERPPMKSVTKILKAEVAKLREGDTTGLEHTRRRSTFVIRKPSKKKSSGRFSS